MRQPLCKLYVRVIDRKERHEVVEKFTNLWRLNRKVKVMPEVAIVKQPMLLPVPVVIWYWRKKSQPVGVTDSRSHTCREAQCSDLEFVIDVELKQRLRSLLREAFQPPVLKK